MFKKHFFLTTAVGILIALILVGGIKLGVDSAIKAAKAKGAASASRAVTVAEVAVAPHVFSDRIEALGVAKARQSVTVTSNTAELITKVRFGDGQSVTKGQVLVELKGDEQDAAVLQAQALASQARRDAKRWHDLAEQGYAPKVTAEQYQANSAQADAALAAAKSRRLNRVIRAPFSGVVGLSDVAPGALIAAGGPIVSLDDVAVMRIDFEVPDRYVAGLKKGLALSASTDAYPDQRFGGKIAQIDTRVDERTRAVRARAEVPNPDHRIKPGMLVRVTLDQGSRTALAVPEAAVQFEADQPFVFVIAPKDDKIVAKRQSVKVGARQDGMIEIVSGLEPGTKIIADGLNRVQPDQAIKLAGKQRAKPDRGPGQ